MCDEDEDCPFPNQICCPTKKVCEIPLDGDVTACCKKKRPFRGALDDQTHRRATGLVSQTDRYRCRMLPFSSNVVAVTHEIACVGGYYISMSYGEFCFHLLTRYKKYLPL